jgi:hypothetical protein
MRGKNNGKDDNGRNGKIEVIVEDKEFGQKIIVAQFKKSFMFPESFSEEVAETLYKYMSNNSGKLMGKIKPDYRDIVFFVKPLNDKPFQVNKQKKEKRFYNKKRKKRQILRF